MTLLLTFVLGVILGLAVSPGWFWLAGVALALIMVAEVAADW